MYAYLMFKGFFMFPLCDVMDVSNRYYYENNAALGAQGDFITAPEISQIFGEILALWVLLACEKIQRNAPTIVELGPGRGTLMTDMVRTFQKTAPSLFQTFEPHIIMVDTSKSLQMQQKKALEKCPYALSFDAQIPFDDDMMRRSTFFIANEFFDALPITQYMYQKQEWHEIYLAFEDQVMNLKDCIGQKATKHLQSTTLPFLANSHAFKEGDIIEYSKDRLDVAAQISAHIKHYGGGALIIDYGDFIQNPRVGDTFQAIKNHGYVNPFDHVGTSDWTSHVDFYALKTVFEEDELSCTFDTQGEFLKKYGFDARLSQLLKSCVIHEQYNDTVQRANRLVDPKEMGDLFKILSVLKIPPCIA